MKLIQDTRRSMRLPKCASTPSHVHWKSIREPVGTGIKKYSKPYWNLNTMNTEKIFFCKIPVSRVYVRDKCKLVKNASIWWISFIRWPSAADKEWHLEAVRDCGDQCWWQTWLPSIVGMAWLHDAAHPDQPTVDRPRPQFQDCYRES